MLRFRPSRLSERLARLPMVRALLPFAAGILLAQSYDFPGWLPVAALLLTAVPALLLRSSSALAVLLLAAGAGQTQLRRPHRSVPLQVTTRLELRIEGLPSVHPHYTTVEAVVTAWRHPQTHAWIAADDRLLLYADPAAAWQHGERLLCEGRVRPLRSDSEGYLRLMRRRGFTGTLRLDAHRILARTPAATRTLHARAVERLDRLGLSDSAAPLVRALAAGDRSGLTSERRARYAAGGMSHLLAVSGLHTALLFGWLWLLFGWLTLFWRGDILYRLLLVGAVWLFVAAAGFPPSAVRAALLCTLLQGALATGRSYDAGNALATAALLMLLWQPAWIGDISFQLSFVAVTFLLLWGVPLQRWFRTHRRLPDLVLGAWLVSLVAGAATAPLVAHTFGMVPLAGMLLNPVALLPAALLVLLGAVWMVLPLPGWAPLLRSLLEGAAGMLDALALRIAQVPGGCLAWQPDGATTLGIYALMLAATLAAGALERTPERGD